MKQLIALGLILLSSCSIFKKKKVQTPEAFAQHFFQDFKVGKFDWILNQYATDEELFELFISDEYKKIDLKSEGLDQAKELILRRVQYSKEVFEKEMKWLYQEYNSPRAWSYCELDSVDWKKYENELIFHISDNDFRLELTLESVHQNRKTKSFFLLSNDITMRTRHLNRYKKFDDENKLLNAQEVEKLQEKESNKVFMMVEQSPEFPGGEVALMEYIKQNLVYPSKAKKEKIEGIVYVDFTVNKTGAVQDVKVKKTLGNGFDEEAIRLVKSMPKWRPGKQNGEALNVKFTLPVSFKLD